MDMGVMTMTMTTRTRAVVIRRLERLLRRRMSLRFAGKEEIVIL
jgi:hypothetical protein